MCIQEYILDMKTVRSLSSKGIIFTDEILRDAGKTGANAGKELRTCLLAYLNEGEKYDI